uniref:Uncharacterized protein n=1 Tax=Knipowitschia caucasica TaxID=637954 RepID=A0AAV2LEJ0_KNICA
MGRRPREQLQRQAPAHESACLRGRQPLDHEESQLFTHSKTKSPGGAAPWFQSKSVSQEPVVGVHESPLSQAVSERWDFVTVSQVAPQRGNLAKKLRPQHKSLLRAQNKQALRRRAEFGREPKGRVGPRSGWSRSGGEGPRRALTGRGRQAYPQRRDVALAPAKRLSRQNKGCPPFPIPSLHMEEASAAAEISRTIWAIDRPPPWSQRLGLFGTPPHWLGADNRHGGGDANTQPLALARLLLTAKSAKLQTGI